MSYQTLQEMLAVRSYLLADGAMGTNLFKRGLQSGDAPELWNVEHVDRVASVHQEFVDAGSDIILTNSFGCNRYRLKLHGCEDRVYELARAAASRAREVADSVTRPVLVGGSVGPTGELLHPVGTVTFNEAKQAFLEQIQGLKDGGADIIWIETISAREEAAAAVAAGAEAEMPVVSTMTFDTAGKTMMGIAPDEAYEYLKGLSSPPVAVGANCGLGATENILSILTMTTSLPSDALIVAKANCGVPQFKDGQFTYSGTPELMAIYARLARDCGARIIGGCCGTDGKVLAAISAALSDYVPGSRPDEKKVIELLGPLSTGVAQVHGHGCDHSDRAITGESQKKRRARRRTSR